MSTISWLLFDLGGVLVRNVGFERLNSLLPAPLEAEALKAKLLSSPSFRGFELGDSTPETFAQSLVHELRLRCTPIELALIRIGWNATLPFTHDGGVGVDARPRCRRRYSRRRWA
jgi:hypothetical protein